MTRLLIHTPDTDHAEFMETAFPGFAERKAKRLADLRARCNAAIDRGDTYGFPPAMVEDCLRERERADLEPKELPNGRWSVAA